MEAMSWFKKNNAEQQQHSSTSDEFKTAVLWTRTVSPEEIKEIHQTLEARIGQAAFGDDKWKKRCKSTLQNFFTRLPTIDRQQLKDPQAFLLWEVIHRSLPQQISYMRTEMLDQGDPSYLIDEFNEYIVKLMRDHLNYWPQILAPSRKKSVDTETVIDLNHKEANDRLHSLVSLLTTAQQQENSVEDSFTLEQVVNSYIPEALRLFNGLSNVSPEVTEQAANILVQQLTLIENQVRSIVQKNTAHSLSQMQAHLEFLEAKSLQPASPMLKLEK